eukprot:UN15326
MFVQLPKNYIQKIIVSKKDITPSGYKLCLRRYTPMN